MNATPILPGLSAVEGKLLTATFDAGRLSSDGGMIVLREIAERLDLAETITGPLRDDLDPGRVRHSYSEMAMARMVMIAAGYEDCDDARLACARPYRPRPDRSLLPQLRAPAGRIVLDIDDTDDPVHGQQELALFNAHYDCTCFQPIHIFDGLTGKPVLSLLRPGKRPSGEEVANGAPLPSAALPGPRVEPVAQACRACRGDAHGH